MARYGTFKYSEEKYGAIVPQINVVRPKRLLKIRLPRVKLPTPNLP